MSSVCSPTAGQRTASSIKMKLFAATSGLNWFTRTDAPGTALPRASGVDDRREGVGARQGARVNVTRRGQHRGEGQAST